MKDYLNPAGHLLEKVGPNNDNLRKKKLTKTDAMDADRWYNYSG